jgi:uncharacterized membrane protein
MIKQTFKNFYAEHRTLTFVIAGAIGLPIAMAVLVGLFALALMVFSFIFGRLIGTLVLLLVLFGALAGLIAANVKEKEHADYY